MADLDATKLSQSEEELREMGPIDYAVFEWPRGVTPSGVADNIVALVDRGLVRILDLAVIAKEEDGIVTAVDLGSLEAFGQFQGASSGLIGDEDLAEAGAVLEPGTMAAVIIWENSWLAPTAVALRRSCAQLVANGRIPVQALIAALDALETDD